MPGDVADRPPNEKAEASFELRGCKITRRQLDRIWELTTKDFPENAYIAISTERKGGGITAEISGKTIDEMRQNVKRSTISGDPDRIDNLTAYISDGLWENQRVMIGINNGASGVWVSVAGVDPGWVIGRASSLKDLFADTRSKHVSRISKVRYYASIAGIAIAALLMIPITHIRDLANHDAVQIVVWISLSAVLAGLGYLLGARIDRQSQTELLFPSSTPHKPRDWVNIAVLAVTIIGVLVTIVAIIVAHSDAVHS